MGRKLISILVILLFITLAALIIKNQPKPVAVKTAKVTKGDISLMVFSSGRVDLSEKQDIRVGSIGSVKNIDVKVGDEVKTNQKLGTVNITNNAVPQTISVNSPIAGTVLTTNVFKGDNFSADTLLFTVGNLSTIYIKGSVNETDLLKVKSGQKVKITGDAFPNKTYTGIVEEVSLSPSDTRNIIVQTGSENIVYPIVIKINDKNTLLKPGFSTDLAITTNTRKKVLNVPQEATIESNKKIKVYTVSNGKVKIRNVSTGLRNDTRVEILKGLKLNDKIILNPDPAILKEGTLVNTK